MSDFWIGDWVKIISSNKIGKYEGKINRKAKIKIENNTYMVNPVDIILLAEDEIPKSKDKIKIVSTKSIESPLLPFKNTLDLHIEILLGSIIYN